MNPQKKICLGLIKISLIPCESEKKTHNQLSADSHWMLQIIGRQKGGFEPISNCKAKVHWPKEAQTVSARQCGQMEDGGHHQGAVGFR